jgi:chemotaxis response regulator CheB
VAAGHRAHARAAALQLVGAAADGEEALRMTAELRPDAMTFDLHTPGIS